MSIIEELYSIPFPPVPYSPSLDSYPPERARVPAIVDGPGLRLAVAGNAAFFDIRLNATIANVIYAYATFESKETVFAVLVPSPGEVFRITFTAPLPGSYTLRMDLLTKHQFFPLVWTSPTSIIVQVDTSGLWMRCASLPLLAAHNCLRWGWTFRPKSGCYYEDWKPQELAALASPPVSRFSRPQEADNHESSQWIVFLGTSRIRGVFFSAVDTLLDGKAGDFVSIGKCWGTIDVRVGTFRLTFQDFRAPIVVRGAVPTPENDIVCHGDRVANYQAEFARNATLYVMNLFQDKMRSPSAVVIDWERWQSPEIYQKLVPIPVDWDGKAILVNFRSQLNDPLDASPISDEERRRWERVLRRSLDFIDTFDIIRPWLRFGEFGVRASSQHWHNVHTPRTSFGVDGIITDALAQIIFNRVLGPKPAATKAWIERVEQCRAVKPEIRICADCAPDLLPFHTNVHANLSCVTTIHDYHFAPKHSVYNKQCPEWCMKQPQQYDIATQTGSVPVRVCRIQAMRELLKTRKS